MSVPARFNAVIHAPVRLQICALLAAVDGADFAAVRDTIGISDSVLSKHVATLEGAGYLKVGKATVASRVRTSLSLTRAGRAAFAGHVAELHRITGGIGGGPAPDTIPAPETDPGVGRPGPDVGGPTPQTTRAAGGPTPQTDPGVGRPVPAPEAARN